MDLWNNVIVNPPFRNDPPVKVNVTARTMGIIALVFGILGGLALLLLLPAVVFVSTAANDLCHLYNDCVTNSYPLATFGIVVGIVGVVAQIVGGIWMMNGQVKGRALLVYALILGVLGNLLVTVNYGGGTSFFGIVLDLVIYYFLVIARFPGEAPLATTTGTPPSYGSPPPSAPPSAPPSTPPSTPPAPPAPPAAPPSA